MELSPFIKTDTENHTSEPRDVSLYEWNLNLPVLGFLFGAIILWLTYSIRQKSFARPTHPGLSVAFSHTPCPFLFRLCSSPQAFLKFLTLAKLPPARELDERHFLCLEPSSLTLMLSQLPLTLQRSRSGQTPLPRGLHWPSEGASCLSAALRAPCFSSPCGQLLLPSCMCLKQYMRSLSPHQTALCRLCLFL